MHTIRSFENDIIQKKKMAAEDQAVILCFTLVSFWRRRAQWCSAAKQRMQLLEDKW